MTPATTPRSVNGAQATGPYLAVGLGNPGTRYENTRHNVGQMVLDHIATSSGGRFSAARRAQAHVIEGRFGTPGNDHRVILAKPSTFMNVSGTPVASLSEYYHVEPAHVIALHDDVDLPFGAIKLKIGGGEGGHNGLRSISKSLGTKDYVRVRIGVGRPPQHVETADFVLGNFSPAEKRGLDNLIADAAEALDMLIVQGLTAAQQHYHSREGR